LMRPLSLGEKADSSSPRRQLRRGLLLRRRRVALPGSHAQPAMAWRSDLYFGLSKSNSSLDVLRHITKRVLLAKIASDSCRHAGDGFAFTREVGDASRIFAEPAKKARVFFPVIRTDQNDGVDQRLRLASLCQHLRILEMAGIVSAIADDNEGLFAPAAVLQMVEPLTHGIVQRGSSPRGNGVEGFLEILWIAGKCLPLHKFNGHVIVEIHDEHFVLWITGMREGGHRGNDIREHATHASAVVNDEPDGNRSVSFLECGDLLQLPVFKDAKVVPLETRDKCSVRVRHIDRQQDEIHGERDFRLGFHAGRQMRRRERRRETEDAEEKPNRSKEQVTIAQITLAEIWIEGHEKTFSRRET